MINRKNFPIYQRQEAISPFTTHPVHRLSSLGCERKSLITPHLCGLSLPSFLQKTVSIGLGIAFNLSTLGSKHTIRSADLPSFFCAYPFLSLGRLSCSDSNRSAPLHTDLQEGSTSHDNTKTAQTHNNQRSLVSFH